MDRPHRSDRSTRGLVRLRDLTAARRHRQDPESGQAMVEFALILFPLLILVGRDHPVRHRAQLLARHEPRREPGRALGGRQQLAAAVPSQHTVGYTCNSTPSACAAALANGSTGTLQDVLRCSDAEPVNHGHICYPGETPRRVQSGDPVRVKLTGAVQVLVRAIASGSRSRRPRRCGSSRRRR